MRCAICLHENKEGSRFCAGCGEILRGTCPHCGKPLPAAARFCSICGGGIGEIPVPEKQAPEPGGERKQVAVLFSDLSGYTAISEKLDPEEVREIVTRILAEVSRIIVRYEGLIEMFVGDAVMAVFGVPKAHEDDSVRAIKAAREIHEMMEKISPDLEEKVGSRLSMHTGINTGLVVTGEVDPDKGLLGVSGDTVNIASRLQGLAKSGEILVGEVTYRQAESYFNFEEMEATTLKGRVQPVKVYKVICRKERPFKFRRLSGLRADLIGRRAEMDRLRGAIELLKRGEGAIFVLSGGAGTGKTRLVEEFKNSLNLNEVQWREGRAYSYSQNIPYYPLIDLLNGAFRIEDEDPPEVVRYKIESGITYLIGEEKGVVPYIGSLYALSYPEVEGIGPDFWRTRLTEAARTVLTALTQRAPTIICLEDLHWADPSSVDLLRSILLASSCPSLFLCIYRPPFRLFTDVEPNSIGKYFQEIRLLDLSQSETEGMIESLLNSDQIPVELRRFAQEKVGGNPFYIEELMNSLVEAKVLIRESGRWKISGSITDADIPSTIQGVISARIDRLESKAKRVLQEASVIGKAFPYELLKKVTDVGPGVDSCIAILVHHDFIRKRSAQPEIEYVFKHALIQEVVYGGLLRKDRQAIHERVAVLMENLFKDRLTEFHETLAFHYARGQSLDRALDYLLKSGEKCSNKYSVEEAHKYYREAYHSLLEKGVDSETKKCILVDLILRWSLVFYYRGDFAELTDLLVTHRELAESLGNKEILGMYYSSLGFALRCREELKDSYKYLHKALALGKETDNKKVTAYAYSQLGWTCSELGLLDEAVQSGERAEAMSETMPPDHFLYCISLFGLVQAYWYKGLSKKVFEVGQTLLVYGKENSHIRSTVCGYWAEGHSFFNAGDFPAAIACYRKAVETSADPYYAQIPRVMLGYSYVSAGQFEKAEEVLKEVEAFSRKFGVEITGTAAYGLLGIVLTGTGHLKEGVRKLEDVRRTFLGKERMCLYAASENTLGRVYLMLAHGTRSGSLSLILKNIGFLAKNLPFASRRARLHFEKAIEVAGEIGAKGILGQAYLNLGLLHIARKKIVPARECLSEAVRLFTECEAGVYLRQATEALASVARGNAGK
jgi:class 3 adenylate cyclase/tetratricopeptide (TPR) repeat protein